MTRTRSIRLIGRCTACGMPLPLNRPAVQVECTQCGAANPIIAGLWSDLIINIEATGGASPPDGYVLEVSDREPAGGRTEPAPRWLTELVPSLDAITTTAAEPPAPLTEPVVMQCPTCSAGLNIDASRERTTTCEYCQASVWLPDGLWRKFHPVEQARWWSLRFSGQSTADRTKARERLDGLIEARREQAEAAAAPLTVTRFLLAWVVVFVPLIVAVGVPSCGISSCAGSDPLFGLMGSFLCPRTCDTCTPPIKTWARTSGGSKSTIYVCQRDGSGMPVGDNEVSTIWVVLTFTGFWGAAALLITVVVLARSRLFGKKKRLAKIHARIAELERQRAAL